MRDHNNYGKEKKEKREILITGMLCLLKDFKVLDINESNFVYFGNEKYFIDGVAQKI